MANDGTVDQQQLQETLNEAYRIAGEWVGRILALSEVTKDGQLGELAIYETIEAAINGGRLGNAGSVRNGLGLGVKTLNSTDDMFALPGSEIFYKVEGSKPANLPPEVHPYSEIFVLKGSSTNNGILVIDSYNQVFITASNAGTFRPWRRLVHGDNTFGAITSDLNSAQFENGSNANGSYSRANNGELICRENVVLSPIDSNSLGMTWVFPYAFKNTDIEIQCSFNRNPYLIDSEGSVNYSNANLILRNSVLVGRVIDKTKGEIVILNTPDDLSAYGALGVSVEARGYWK